MASPYWNPKMPGPNGQQPEQTASELKANYLKQLKSSNTDSDVTLRSCPATIVLIASTTPPEAVKSINKVGDSTL